MVLKGESKIYKNPNARTFYLTIPSSMVMDSQFPFKKGDIVKLKIENNILIVKKKGVIE